MPNTPHLSPGSPVDRLDGGLGAVHGRSALGGVGVSRADAGSPDPESDFRTARRHASTDVSAVECLLDTADAVEGFQFEFWKIKTKGSKKALHCSVNAV